MSLSGTKEEAAAGQGKKERALKLNMKEQITKMFLDVVISGGKEKETLLIDDNRPRTREYYSDHQKDSNVD